MLVFGGQGERFLRVPGVQVLHERFELRILGLLEILALILREGQELCAVGRREITDVSHPRLQEACKPAGDLAHAVREAGVLLVELRAPEFVGGAGLLLAEIASKLLTILLCSKMRSFSSAGFPAAGSRYIWAIVKLIVVLFLSLLFCAWPGFPCPFQGLLSA